MKQRTRALALALAASILALPALPAAAADPPVLTLTMNRSIYVAGQTATFTSHVEAMNLNWGIEYQYPGSTQWKPLCAAVNVNTDTFSCQLPLAYNMQVRASLIDTQGTETTADDTLEARVNRSVPVKVKIGTTPLGYYSRSGGYAVFARGASPTYRAATYPAFPGKWCLRHEVQRHYATGWRKIFTSACRVEDSKGRVDWRWAGKHASGVKFRVRATFAGDAINRANVSTWNYLRFR